MRRAQVLVYENDHRLTAMLEEPALQARFSLRHPRDLSECMELLREGGPGVLVLKLGRNLEFELTLLEQVCRLFPETACVIVAEEVHAPVAGLAWDLGASYVMVFPQHRDLLADVVVGLLQPVEGAS